MREAEGKAVQFEAIPEIIAKKICYRGSEAKPRDIFNIAAAARSQLEPVVNAARVPRSRFRGPRISWKSQTRSLWVVP